MNIDDALEQAGHGDDERQHDRQLHQLRRQVAAARADRDEAFSRSERAERELATMLRLDERRGKPPVWLKRAPKTGTHHGTPWLLLSDLHLDEVVMPAEIGNVNAYNRTIAELRLRATFDNCVAVCEQYWTGVVFDGIVVCLAGDLFSGDIHDELTQTNEDTMLGSLLHWSDQIAAGLAMLADVFGAVHVPVVVGNHGRRTRKPRSKWRARDNFDWFMGHLLARMLAHDDRITFDISDAADCLVPAYGRTVCVTHGDQARGGSGIAGIYSPIMRLDARKRQRAAAVMAPYDLLVMGHWHSLIFGPQWIVNGSLKGYDEYAYTENFSFEEPQQALWLMTPEHGKTWTAPILPANRRAERW